MGQDTFGGRYIIVGAPFVEAAAVWLGRTKLLLSEIMP
jgi:hypothetical protein